MEDRTGFASIDKPWMKWHSSKGEGDWESYTNFYDYFLDCTTQYEDIELIRAETQSYRRGEMLREVERLANLLSGMGIVRGDVVSLMMLNVPEVTLLLLAILRIGACCNLIKYDETPERVNKMLKRTDSRVFFITQIPEIVKTAITVSTMNSELCYIVEVPLMPTETPLHPGFYLYSDLPQSHREEVVDVRTAAPEDTAVIVYSGGTTGDAKGIELTHRNLMAMSFGLKHSCFGFVPGKISLNILPPAVAYYLNATVGLMICGVSVIYIPFFRFEDYPKLIAQNRVNVVFSGPVLLKELQKSSIDDLSFLTNPCSGGDKLYPAEEEAINQSFAKKHCPAPVQQGYGESEVSAVASCNPEGHFVVGSIGVPMCNVIISIFEYGTDHELPYRENAVGEICITGPTLMKGYYKDQAATEAVLRLHRDGKYWIHTDDLGRMDADGYIFHCGRAKRMLTRSGAKVWLTPIESEASALDFVAECCAVRYEDPVEREVPVLHLILKYWPDFDVVGAIDATISNKLPASCVPKYYVIRQSIPYTETNKKMDYRALENENLSDERVFAKNGRLIQKID